LPNPISVKDSPGYGSVWESCYATRIAVTMRHVLMNWVRIRGRLGPESPGKLVIHNNSRTGFGGERRGVSRHEWGFGSCGRRGLGGRCGQPQRPVHPHTEYPQREDVSPQREPGKDAA